MFKEKLKGFAVGVVVASVAVAIIPTMADKVTKTAELFYNDIKVVVDGQQAVLTDANGNQVEPFIIDGTTYLPVRGVASAMNKAVSWDGATRTVYLGANEEIQQPSVWLKDLDTFVNEVETKSLSEVDFGGSDYNGVLTDNTGKTYQNYIRMRGNDVKYLLNYKYSRFKGTYYLKNEQKSNTNNYRIVVKGDDKVIYTSQSVTAGEMPVPFDIDVSNVGVLEIVYQEQYNDGSYNNSSNPSYYTGIGNAGLYE